MLKTYRIVMFDKNFIRPNIEQTITAESKTMALAAAHEMLHMRAQREIELVTNGMAVCTTTMLNSKGEEVTCTMREVSPEYYNYLIDECWGFASCEIVDGNSKGVSSENAVAAAEKKLKANYDACEHDEIGESSVARRKRRWTKAQKRAAKAAREAAANKVA